MPLLASTYKKDNKNQDGLLSRRPLGVEVSGTYRTLPPSPTISSVVASSNFSSRSCKEFRGVDESGHATQRTEAWMKPYLQGLLVFSDLVEPCVEPTKFVNMLLILEPHFDIGLIAAPGS